MVSISKLSSATSNGKLQHLCGSSLIDSMHLLTGAACFEYLKPLKLDSLVLILGDQNLTEYSEYRIERNIKKLVIHPKYKAGLPYFDVAVITLNEPVGESYESFDRKRALVKYQSQSEAIKVIL